MQAQMEEAQKMAQIYQTQSFLNLLPRINLDFSVFDARSPNFMQIQPLQNTFHNQQSELNELNSLSPSSKKIHKHPSKQATLTPKSCPKSKRSPWQSQEDAQVIELVNKLGHKWTEIGKIVGGRTGKQVRERYLYTLNPDINKDKWTKEEDSLLMSLYQQFGNKWQQIAQYLPGRTENQIKNRLNPRFREIKSLPCSDNLTDSKCLDTPLMSSTYDDELSPQIDLECNTNFEKSCESILGMSPMNVEGSFGDLASRYMKSSTFEDDFELGSKIF